MCVCVYVCMCVCVYVCMHVCMYVCWVPPAPRKSSKTGKCWNMCRNQRYLFNGKYGFNEKVHVQSYVFINKY